MVLARFGNECGLEVEWMQRVAVPIAAFGAA
jgi:hypothetical protein